MRKGDVLRPCAHPLASSRACQSTCNLNI